MEMFSTIVKKCYVMIEPKQFFQAMLAPCVFMPLLEFAFDGGENTKQGAEFMKLFFHNAFLSEPVDAFVDVVEINFGFEITQMAGEDVKEENKNCLNLSDVQKDAKHYKRRNSHQHSSQKKGDVLEFEEEVRRFKGETVKKIGFF